LTFTFCVIVQSERLDRFLADQLALSRTQAGRLIADKRVTARGKALRASAVLERGTEVTVDLPDESPPRSYTPFHADLKFVYEDEHLAVLFGLVQKIGRQKAGLKPVLVPKPLQGTCRKRFGGLGGRRTRKRYLLHPTDLTEHRMYVDEEHALTEQLRHPTIVSGELINEASRKPARRRLEFEPFSHFLGGRLDLGPGHGTAFACLASYCLR